MHAYTSVHAYDPMYVHASVSCACVSLACTCIVVASHASSRRMHVSGVGVACMYLGCFNFPDSLLSSPLSSWREGGNLTFYFQLIIVYSTNLQLLSVAENAHGSPGN